MNAVAAWKKDSGIGVGIAVVSVALFIVLRSQTLVSDGAIYALNVGTHDFFNRSIHFGYYVIGAGVATIGRACGVPLDTALVLFNALLMAVALGLAYGWFRAQGAPVARAVLATVLLGLTGNVIGQATTVEVYALELASMLGAYWLALSGRWTLAGACFGLALLVTPLALFGGAYFVWVAWRRRQFRGLMQLGVIAAMMLGALLAFAWREYFFGVRGLLSTASQHVDFSLANARYNVVALLKNFQVMTPCLIIGAMTRRARETVLLAAVTTVLHLRMLFGMREEGVFLLLAYPFFALIAACGIEWLWQRRPTLVWRAAAVAGMVAYGPIAGALWVDPIGASYKQTLIAFLRETPEDTLVMASWEQECAIRLYEWMEEIPPKRLVRFDNETPSDVVQIMGSSNSIVAFEKHDPSRLARLKWLRRREVPRFTPTWISEWAPGYVAKPLVEVPGGPVIYRVVGERS